MQSSKSIPTRPRPNTEMNVIEQPWEWLRNFRKGWLAHFEETGEINWKKYSRIKNDFSPSGKKIELSNSRIMLISSAGGYLKHEQKPFDAANLMGDYSLRLFSPDTPFDQIAYTHEHYDHKYVDADPQVLLPLQHLNTMVNNGVIGELAPIVINFMGYQPNVLRVVKELIPLIVEIAKKNKVQGALLVPT